VRTPGGRSSRVGQSRRREQRASASVIPRRPSPSRSTPTISPDDRITERLIVEVYCPRAWEGLDDYVDELKDALNQLDLPFDYEYALRVDQLEQLGRA
jgi:hypothetical protein